MKVLVIGQGGREHALIRALSLSLSVTELHAIPGSDGIRKNALCHDLDWKNTDSIIQFCQMTSIDLVIIGPEDPLVAGLADKLRKQNINTLGPGSLGAQLEGSKVYAKEFMVEANVPTAPFFVVKSIEETIAYSTKFAPPYVFKVDGLAAGKGVYICQNIEELKAAAIEVFEKKIFGEAGKRALLEKFTKGWELSYIVITNGEQFQTLPIAQDHKRLLDGDQGPNTGGMGTVAPLRISDELKTKIDTEVILPTLQLLKQKNILYRGFLFVGMMITNDGFSVLEYNCRLGDPETQVLLPLIDGDLGKIFLAFAKGDMAPIKWKTMSATCVILAAPGYPQKPEKDVPIEGDLNFESPSSYFIHAGTKKNANGDWVTSGGRVLCAVGLGSNFHESVQNAYLQAEKASWKGLQKRKDIGSKVTSSISG